MLSRTASWHGGATPRSFDGTTTTYVQLCLGHYKNAQFSANFVNIRSKPAKRLPGHQRSPRLFFAMDKLSQRAVGSNFRRSVSARGRSHRSNVRGARACSAVWPALHPFLNVSATCGPTKTTASGTPESSASSRLLLYAHASFLCYAPLLGFGGSALCMPVSRHLALAQVRIVRVRQGDRVARCATWFVKRRQERSPPLYRASGQLRSHGLA